MLEILSPTEGNSYPVSKSCETNPSENPQSSSWRSQSTQKKIKILHQVLKSKNTEIDEYEIKRS